MRIPRAKGAVNCGLFGLLVVCALALAPSQSPQLDVDDLRAKIRKAVADGTTPSLAVAVARGGRILWSEGFGYADREARVPATADTPYSIASVTKPFTATAVMILEQRQRVALDEPVSRYLGPLIRPGVGKPNEVTLRRILGHVAGFPLHYQYFFEGEAHRPLSFADTMRCYGAEIQPPGNRFTYSNLGFGVLGETVARVSGQRYRDFLAHEVFAPLALKHASVPELAEEAAGAAKRYGRDGRPLPFYLTDHAGASAVYASVEDLVRFGSFHAGALMSEQRAVLTLASLAAMQQPGLGDYGLGWSINRDWNGHRVIWHSGAMPGSSATLWLVPAEKIAIALVGNQITGPVNQLAGEILQDLLRVGPPAATGSRGPEEATPANPASTGASTVSPVGRYRGTVSSCPKPEVLAIDIGGPSDIGVTLGKASARQLEEASLTAGRLSGTFGSTGSGDITYRLELRAVGERLEGPVIRRTSLGPRANVAVTLWAALERER